MHAGAARSPHRPAQLHASQLGPARACRAFRLHQGRAAPQIDALKDARRIPMHDQKLFDPGVGTTLYDLERDPQQTSPFPMPIWKLACSIPVIVCRRRRSSPRKLRINEEEPHQKSLAHRTGPSSSCDRCCHRRNGFGPDLPGRRQAPANHDPDQRLALVCRLRERSEALRAADGQRDQARRDAVRRHAGEGPQRRARRRESL
jgi:hypothetical protein